MRSASAVSLATSGGTVINWTARRGCRNARGDPAARPREPTRFGSSACGWLAGATSAGDQKNCAAGCNANIPAPGCLPSARWDGCCDAIVGRNRAWPALCQASRPNEVWTVDFKGYFRTADGRRCDPLTVRDAYSRFGLCVQVLHGHKRVTVQRVFLRLFRRFGLPRRIHADQGRPWAGPGPAWLSQLSAWWVSLGIRPTFSRRARPGDNASHEPWHRELKADTTRPPAATPPAQQRRFAQWLRTYNHERPHEALGLRRPAEYYYRSRRR